MGCGLRQTFKLHFGLTPLDYHPKNALQLLQNKTKLFKKFKTLLSATRKTRRLYEFVSLRNHSTFQLPLLGWNLQTPWTVEKCSGPCDTSAAVHPTSMRCHGAFCLGRSKPTKKCKCPKKSEVNKISISPAQRVGRYLLHAVNCYFHLEYSLKKMSGKVKMTVVKNLFPNTLHISRERSGSFSQNHVLMLKGYLGMW